MTNAIVCRSEDRSLKLVALPVLFLYAVLGSATAALWAVARMNFDAVPDAGLRTLMLFAGAWMSMPFLGSMVGCLLPSKPLRQRLLTAMLPLLMPLVLPVTLGLLPDHTEGLGMVLLTFISSVIACLLLYARANAFTALVSASFATPLPPLPRPQPHEPAEVKALRLHAEWQLAEIALQAERSQDPRWRFEVERAFGLLTETTSLFLARHDPPLQDLEQAYARVLALSKQSAHAEADRAERHWAAHQHLLDQTLNPTAQELRL